MFVYNNGPNFNFLIIKIDKKTREDIKLKAKTGIEVDAEIKGTSTAPTTSDHFAKFFSLKNFIISRQKYSIKAYKRIKKKLFFMDGFEKTHLGN